MTDRERPGNTSSREDPSDDLPGERRREGASGFTDATHGDREVDGPEIVAHEHSLPRAGQRDFEPDVERLHRSILREPRDPTEGREPAPWWVWAAAAIALFWGGWYLGRHGGVFGPEAHLAFPEIRRPIAEEARQQAVAAIDDPVAAGESIYRSRCQACHQQDGLGVVGAFPPIVDSEWVVGPPEYVVLVVLHGLTGPITVQGEAYAGAMPGWADILSDDEIAAVATYIRQWDTNEAPPVDAELVVRLRAEHAGRQEPWTVPELEVAAAEAATAAPEGDATGQTDAGTSTAPSEPQASAP